MKVLLSDRIDFTPTMLKESADISINKAIPKFTESEIKECEILSVFSNKIKQSVLDKFENLKWIVNRNPISNDNLYLHQCEKSNIGVVNCATLSQKCIVNWLEKTINENYYLPYYTVLTESKLGKLLNKKYENVKVLTLKSKPEDIHDVLSETNTLIVALPHIPKTDMYINKGLIDILPENVNLINLSFGKLMNNKDLLSAINEGKINHITADSLNSECRNELLATGAVDFTKNVAWKYKLNRKSYLANLRKHITAIENGKPINVVLNRK